MAGRKSVKNRKNGNVEEYNQSNKETTVSTTTARRKSFLSISPNGELRQRLIETAIDVKENIPEEHVETRRMTRSCKIRIDVDQRSDSCDSRKRRSSQNGPPAKRPSVEKSDSSEEDSLQNDSGSSSSISSKSSISGPRTRSSRLPVMEEENEIFDSSEMSREEFSEETSISQAVNDIEDNDVNDELFEDEEEEFDDEEEEEEEEDPLKIPLQNEEFDQMKRHLNDVPKVNPPSLLNPRKCVGIGSPEKVWSLMVSRDDLARATKCLLNNHPGMSYNMRCMLIDWMMEVCESENLHRETFHLSVDYVDRFLDTATVEVTQDTFQLLGTAALFVAAKYEEIYPPKCNDFANLTDGAYNPEAVRTMEILLVRSLNWTLGPITSIQWLSTYLQLLGNGSEQNENEHFCEDNYFVPKLLREEFIHMCRILDYLLFETNSLSFTYRTISAAVLFACFEPKSSVEKATGFAYDQLLPVIHYVEPVVRVFESLRQAGDPFPVNNMIQSDDVHNMQTYFKFDSVKDDVEKERKKQKSVGCFVNCASATFGSKNEEYY